MGSRDWELFYDFGIPYKIKNVSDSLCRKCHQCYEDKCRAFCVPHSEEERLQREGKECLCMKLGGNERDE